MIEEYLTDDGKTGFKSIFDDLGEALQEITKNASSDSTKSAFISTAKSMADYFNNMTISIPSRRIWRRSTSRSI